MRATIEPTLFSSKLSEYGVCVYVSMGVHGVCLCVCECACVLLSLTHKGGNQIYVCILASVCVCVCVCVCVLFSFFGKYFSNQNITDIDFQFNQLMFLNRVCLPLTVYHIRQLSIYVSLLRSDVVVCNHDVSACVFGVKRPRAADVS